jgi:hypothetical protein
MKRRRIKMADEKKPEDQNVPSAQKIPDTRKSASDEFTSRESLDISADTRPTPGPEVAIDPTPDKSQESYRTEASQKDMLNAPMLSNMTPSNRDKLSALREGAASGRISAEEFARQHPIGVTTASTEQLKSEAQSLADAGVTTSPEGVKAGVTGEVDTSKLPIEQNQTERQFQAGRGFILTDEQKTRMEELTRESLDLQRGRQLGDIPMRDPYWDKQNEISVFLSDARS